MHSYTKERLYSILVNNLEFSVRDEIVGKVILMEPIEAFKYVTISGSGYLKVDEPEKRVFIKRDYFRVFNQAEQYGVQLGVYSDKQVEFRYTSNHFFEKYPFILEGTKKIIFVEYSKKDSKGQPAYYPVLEELNKKIIQEGNKPTDYVVTLIQKESPRELEPFFEYFVNEYYSRNGYITDSQVPFYYGVGTPDAAAYSIKELSVTLEKHVGFRGCSIFELMHLKKLMGRYCSSDITEDDIVFEAKTCTLDGSQINKYKDKKVFDYSFELIPHKTNKAVYSGLANFDTQDVYNIERESKLVTDNKSVYKKWMDVYIKMYILCNLSEHRFDEFKTEKQIKTIEDLVNTIACMSYDELITKVMED